jgi:hypothetical protein
MENESSNGEIGLGEVLNQSENITMTSQESTLGFW